MDRDRRLLDDVRAVWPDGQRAVATAELYACLVAYRPETYRHWDRQYFGRSLRSAGITPKSINFGGGRVLRGVTAELLLSAVRVHEEIVYFAERDGFVKIGTTRNLESRVAALARGDSAVLGMTIKPVKILATMPGGIAVERSVHRLFAALRFEGEWFLHEDPLAQFIAAIAAASPERTP